MDNRRAFLVKGSLAATAMLVLKPMETIAGEVSGFDLLGSTSSKLVLLYTPYLDPGADNRIIDTIKKIQDGNSDIILLRASAKNNDGECRLSYDATLTDTTDAWANKDYTIVHKAGIKSGIIYAKSGENQVIEKVNRLAAYLKKEKKCAVVVCLSQLGYKCSHTPDDITLASHSSYIDIIIGGHPENFHPLPVIALNKQQAEVIIHAAGDNSFGYGKVAIDFDERGRKKQVSFAV
jgi:hypothetical protein